MKVGPNAARNFAKRTGVLNALSSAVAPRHFPDKALAHGKALQKCAKAVLRSNVGDATQTVKVAQGNARDRRVS